MLVKIYRFVEKQIREHPVRTVFITALFLRLALITIIALHFDGTLFSDDRLYFNMVQAYTNGENQNWDSYSHRLWNLSLSFLMPASVVYKISFQSSWAVLSLSAIIGSIIPAATTRLLGKYVSVPVASGIGITMALMPSQVLWSSLLLKDSYIAIGFIALASVLIFWTKTERTSGFFLGLGGVTFVLFYIYSGPYQPYT